MEAWQHLQPLVSVLIDRVHKDGLGSLTTVERNAFLVWCYPAAVNDGGHASFFYNSYGEFADETVLALVETGLVAYSHILLRAINQFPEARVPRKLDERNSALEALPGEAHETMAECDEAFSQLGDTEVLNRLWGYWQQCAA
jgi:hypothetical protein